MLQYSERMVPDYKQHSFQKTLEIRNVFAHEARKTNVASANCTLASLLKVA